MQSTIKYIKTKLKKKKTFCPRNQIIYTDENGYDFLLRFSQIDIPFGSTSTYRNEGNNFKKTGNPGVKPKSKTNKRAVTDFFF